MMKAKEFREDLHEKYLPQFKKLFLWQMILPFIMLALIIGMFLIPWFHPQGEAFEGFFVHYQEWFEKNSSVEFEDISTDGIYDQFYEQEKAHKKNLKKLAKELDIDIDELNEEEINALAFDGLLYDDFWDFVKSSLGASSMPSGMCDELAQAYLKTRETTNLFGMILPAVTSVGARSAIIFGVLALSLIFSLMFGDSLRRAEKNKLNGTNDTSSNEISQEVKKVIYNIYTGTGKKGKELFYEKDSRVGATIWVLFTVSCIVMAVLLPPMHVLAFGKWFLLMLAAFLVLSVSSGRDYLKKKYEELKDTIAKRCDRIGTVQRVLHEEEKEKPVASEPQSEPLVLESAQQTETHTAE